MKKKIANRQKHVATFPTRHINTNEKWKIKKDDAVDAKRK